MATARKVIAHECPFKRVRGVLTCFKSINKFLQLLYTWNCFSPPPPPHTHTHSFRRRFELHNASRHQGD